LPIVRYLVNRRRLRCVVRLRAQKPDERVRFGFGIHKICIVGLFRPIYAQP